MTTRSANVHNINICTVMPSWWRPSTKTRLPMRKATTAANGIYLPQGTWVDYFTGDRYEGGRIINHFDAPLWKLPVLVKADAIIPMANPNNNPSEMRKDLRIYEIYAQHGTKALEYDDDGNTQAYLDGENTNTQLSTSVNKNTLIFKAERTAGEFNGYNRNKTPNCAQRDARTEKDHGTSGSKHGAAQAGKTREEFEMA